MKSFALNLLPPLALVSLLCATFMPQALAQKSLPELPACLNIDHHPDAQPGYRCRTSTGNIFEFLQRQRFNNTPQVGYWDDEYWQDVDSGLVWSDVAHTGDDPMSHPRMHRQDAAEHCKALHPFPKGHPLENIRFRIPTEADVYLEYSHEFMEVLPELYYGDGFWTSSYCSNGLRETVVVAYTYQPANVGQCVFSDYRDEVICVADTAPSAHSVGVGAK